MDNVSLMRYIHNVEKACDPQVAITSGVVSLFTKSNRKKLKTVHKRLKIRFCLLFVSHSIPKH